MRIFSLLLLSIFLYSCSKNNSEIRKTENLTAFAHTYGLIRWFYPSDEAQEIDWNQFALYGTSQVIGCRSVNELKKTLESLFKPVAPGISFLLEDTPFDQSLITLPDTAGMNLVAWQHHGVDLDIWSNYYVSKRINRPLQTCNVSKVAIYSYFPAEDYKTCELKLKARIKKTSLSDDFKLFLKLTDVDDSYVTFCADTTIVPIVNTGEWEEYECRLLVKDNSNAQVYWGLYTEGEGSFSIDKMILEDVTNNKTVIIPVLDGSITIRFRNNDVYEYIHSEKETKIQTKNLIFEEHANFGDYKSQKLMDGLYVHVPLALYGTKKQTYPESNREALSNLKLQLSKSYQSVPKSIEMWADVIVSWNVINFFSPYLAELSINWENELLNTLSLISSRDKIYNTRPIKLMLAKLEDAHIDIREAEDYNVPDKYSPIRIKKIENQIVVIDAIDSAFKNGDVILKINGIDALKEYESFEDEISGGKHFKSAIAAHQWWRYYNSFSGTITMDVLRDKEVFTLNTNTVTSSEYGKLIGAKYMSLYKPSQWFDNNILYINVIMSNYDEVKKLLGERKPHQTVIIDARNFTRGGWLFRYMIPLLCPDVDLKSNMRYITPKIAFPNTPVIEDTLINMTRTSPNMKNIFLIGPNVFSNFEDTFDNVRYNGLGYFVGTNTGGCNGRGNVFYLPSDKRMCFTGMKVLSEMGAEYYYYRIGIAPDVYVEETIDDIKQGRDAILEKAIEITENYYIQK